MLRGARAHLPPAEVDVRLAAGADLVAVHELGGVELPSLEQLRRPAHLLRVTRLHGLPGVQDVLPSRAIGETLDMRVRIEGGAGRLRGALLSAYELAPETSAAADVQLAYRYQGASRP